MSAQTTTQSVETETMHCPTCRAKQAWSDECRRCKSDLSLLRHFESARRWHWQRCMEHLNAMRFELARRHAEQLLSLDGSAQSRRLFELCCTAIRDFSPQTESHQRPSEV